MKAIPRLKIVQSCFLCLGVIFLILFVVTQFLSRKDMFIYPLIVLRIRPEVLLVVLSISFFLLWITFLVQIKWRFLLFSFLFVTVVFYLFAWPLENESFSEYFSPSGTNTILIREHVSLHDGEYEVYIKNGLILQQLDYYLVCDGGCSDTVISLVWTDEYTFSIVYYNGNGSETTEVTINIPNDETL